MFKGWGGPVMIGNVGGGGYEGFKVVVISHSR